jgi:hypothetical protein
MISANLNRVLLAYERGYRVKNGEVISPFTGKQRKLNIGKQYGYERYRFNIRDEITKNAYPVEVHKLVAYQKYGNELLKPEIEVRHLDGNSLNNLEENIAIGTRIENALDIPQEIRLTRSINASTANRKFTDLEMEEIRRFHTSYKETMERFDISSKGTLHYILNTKYQTNV